MSSFNQFLDAVKSGSKDLARDVFDGFEDQALEDTKAYLENSKQDLQRWTNLLAQGELTKQDFEDLVKAKKALLQIHSLTQAGIALAKLDQFRSRFITMVVNTAFGVFL